MAKKTKKKTVKKAEAILTTQVEAVRSTALAEIRVASPGLVSQAELMTVDDADEEIVAYEAVGNIKRLLKDAEQRRKAITSPLEAAKKETIRLFKDLTAPLHEAQALLTEKIGDFRDKQERIAAEAERKRLKEIADKEAALAEAQRKADARKTKKGKENAQAVADELDDEVTELEQTIYVPDVSTATVAKVWTYEIEDPTIVPRQYCMPDAGCLRSAVRNGERDIKGVRIFQKRSIRN